MGLAALYGMVVHHSAHRMWTLAKPFYQPVSCSCWRRLLVQVQMIQANMRHDDAGADTEQAEEHAAMFSEQEALMLVGTPAPGGMPCSASEDIAVVAVVAVMAVLPFVYFMVLASDRAIVKLLLACGDAYKLLLLVCLQELVNTKLELAELKEQQVRMQRQLYKAQEGLKGNQI